MRRMTHATNRKAAQRKSENMDDTDETDIHGRESGIKVDINTNIATLFVTFRGHQETREMQAVDDMNFLNS